MAVARSSQAADREPSRPDEVGPDPREAAFEEASILALRWCRRLGGPTIDPEDAAQDVLVVVLRRWADLRDPRDLRRWVWGITRRVVAAHRRRSWLARWLPWGPEPSSPAPDDEATRVVYALLDALSEVQREVFLLARIEGRALPEVAQILGIPEGTARSRLRLARASARQLVTTDPRFTCLKLHLEVDDA